MPSSRESSHSLRLSKERAKALVQGLLVELPEAQEERKYAIVKELISIFKRHPVLATVNYIDATANPLCHQEIPLSFVLAYANQYEDKIAKMMRIFRETVPESLWEGVSKVHEKHPIPTRTLQMLLEMFPLEEAKSTSRNILEALIVGGGDNNEAKLSDEEVEDEELIVLPPKSKAKKIEESDETPNSPSDRKKKAATIKSVEENNMQDQDNKKSTTSNSELSIPRKRKSQSPTAEDVDSKKARSSLIANMAAVKPPPKNSAVAHMAIDEDDDDDDDDLHHHKYDDEEGDETGGISLNALKHKILGRQLRGHDDDSYSDDDDDNIHDFKKKVAQYTAGNQISPQLRSELHCAICHEAFLHPVSLLCGHSFCQECVQWWWQSATSQQSMNCPTCRRVIPVQNPSNMGVNTALRACVMALMGDELQARFQACREAQRAATKGENGGAHNGGYKILVPANHVSWKTIVGCTTWKSRRSIVLDAEDQRMQLALGIWKDATNSGVSYNTQNHTLQVSLCLLTMEEDEVADGGFPRVVHEEDDEDNDHLLVSHNGGRFVHSFVRAVVKSLHDDNNDENNSNDTYPLGRRAISANGTAELSLDLSDANLTASSIISLEHEESGATLDLMVPSSLIGDEGGNDNCLSRSRHAAYDSEEDEDGSHLDHYEEDGFLADDADDGDDVDEDDLCHVCSKPGDLMICDGGDNVEGCGKSFHIHCVKRKVVPPGDWICQSCAEDLALDVGIEGYEFPAGGTALQDDSFIDNRPEQELSRDEIEIHDTESEASPAKQWRGRLNKQKSMVLLDDSDSDNGREENGVEEEDDDSDNASGGPPGNEKARHIAEDSDEDEDEEDQASKKKMSAKRNICVIDSDDDDE